MTVRRTHDRKVKMREVIFRNNVLLILIIILIGINSYTFFIVSKDYITGDVSAVGTVNICIALSMTMGTPGPGWGAILNGTYNSSVTASNAMYVDFNYFKFGHQESTFGTDYDVNNDSIYNATLNTTASPDGNCNYRIVARGFGMCGMKKVIGSGVFSINNVDEPPTWTEFNNSMSTNFSNYTSWINIPDANIANPEYGMITFTAQNFDGTDLDFLFNISYNSIFLDLSSTNYPCFFDVVYKIKFFNITQFAEPIVLRNGVPCSSACSNFDYSGGNYSFNVRVSQPAVFSIAEGGNLTINWTFINKTYDNSPTFNISTYMRGSINNISMAATCYYKTDYDPTNYTLMNNTGGTDHSQQLPEQNWSYRPTNMGHYAEIQHHDFYYGIHLLTLNCSVGYNQTESSTTFLIQYTQRDRVYYSDGSEVKLYLRLEETGLNISVNFSQIDSNFDPADVVVVNNGLDYNVSYNISGTNTRAQGQYNVTVEAFNASGFETMNGSIFMHLHNTWDTSDIDNAFDCWSFKQGYYFDEVACDWESDLNHVADLVDVFTIEISCYDGIDNDLDGKADAADTDCAGIYYDIRRGLGIDSAFLGDPCYNNVCRVCLGTDNNGDGICDTSDGTNVRYLNKVKPGYPMKAKYLKSSINNQSVRVSLNYLNTSFDISNSTSSIQQLPNKELGGCTGGQNCRSVTGTTFGPGLPDTFTGALDEKVTATLSPSSTIGSYVGVAAGISISGSSAFQNLVFFEVDASAIVNESDNPEYCFDAEDNDLNEYYDCSDTTCIGAYSESNSTFCVNGRDDDCDGIVDCIDVDCNNVPVVFFPNGSVQGRCEYPNERTCDDNYDNDMDGYTDCNDNDCFQLNGTTGPCYAVEDFNTTSCADSVNNDYDWGNRCDQNTSVSYQTRQTNGSYSSTIQITDCLDIDCNGETGSISLSANCEYCNEITCNDAFDNDADSYYDCIGNAYRSSYDRDCDRWHDVLITCNTTETNCSDDYDNDLDSDSLTGQSSWLGIPVYGGWNCQDLDCNGLAGNSEGDLCQWGNETECDDDFDNDGDGLTDCYDPSSCLGLSGAFLNKTGLCRPCPSIEDLMIDTCRDSDDSDYDGSTDCSDSDCYALAGPGNTYCGLTETNCTDSIDNDFDSLVDQDDPDCPEDTTVYLNEYGPGQCSDGIDNDQDGGTDCSDSDCTGTLLCMFGSYNNPPILIGYVGAIQVYRQQWVKAGDNFTARYRRDSLNVASVVLKLGNVQYPLRNISPVLDNMTSFMTGSLTNFAKVNDTYGLKAQNTDGFNGNLDLYLTATTASGLSPGSYDLFLSTSIPGVYGTKVTTVYIAEDEPPVINSINITVGNTPTGSSSVNVTIDVNATDQGAYNSGIAFCTMNLSGIFYTNSSSCSYTVNLTAGTYNFSAIAYDGAMNPSNLSWKEFNVTVSTLPRQKGPFYKPYPAENYPDKKHFNNSESINIGVNFEGGSGFVDNTSGCLVKLRNKTDVIESHNVSLTVVAGDAVCNGQVDLSGLFTSTNESKYPSAVHYFTVTVWDTALNNATSTREDFNYCYHYYDNSSSKYRCYDECELDEMMNTAPIFMGPIPNYTWPRGTSLSVLDLDDYFYDIDGDPLNFTWVIDNRRINVSIDRAHIVTFTPDQSFYGFGHITFYANDPFTSTSSNMVTLEITFRPLAPSPPIPSGGGGGGGGGGAVNITPEEECEEDWVCANWGPCLITSYQFRECRDRNDCGTNDDMPETARDCLYRPTCRDRVRNQGEEKVDCGGPCPPCASCNDGILNQQETKSSQIIGYSQVFDDDKVTLCHRPGTSAEQTMRVSLSAVKGHRAHADRLGACPGDLIGTPSISDCGGPLCPACPTCEDNKWNQGEKGIDCGGPCPSCARCDDGIRNQGELNIDCGGPCPPCRVRVEEKAFNWNLLALLVSAILLSGLLLIALLFGLLQNKFIRFKAKMLNYYMRSVRMFERRKTVEKELPIMQWVNSHLDTIEQAIPSRTVEQSINSVDRLVRIFFKRVFLIRYAFTNDELVKELEKHKIPTVLRKATEILFEELSQIKYGGEELGKDDIQTLMGQVKVITERTVNEIETKKKTKINISERDISKISQTLSGAHKMGVKEALKHGKK
ncbi:Ig-like domain-containing protein [Nanoarchaeota archaeon]